MSANGSTKPDARDNEIRRLVYGVRDVLREDVDEYWNKLESDDSQLWRRGFVRAVFAYFEGLIASMKFEALLGHKARQVALMKEKIAQPKSLVDIPVLFHEHMKRAERGADFKPWETLCIAEWQFSLNDEGVIKFRNAKISLSGNLCFTFRIHAKAFGVHFEIDRQSAGWANFRRAVKIRDRLTHPRKVEQLDVSDEEVKTVASCMVWISEELKQLLTLIKEHTESSAPPASNTNG